MKPEIKNVVASIRARLSNIAKKEERSFDSLLLLYIQERLLYRLSLSQYSEKFVLKGGLLMFIITDFKGRPTKDMDFLAQQVSNDIDDIKEIFCNICVLDCVNDGLQFSKESISVSEIKKGADYHGVRVNITCYLGNAKKIMQLDIGFGDIVIPKPQFMECPTLLDMEAPSIRVYSLESVISEKFHAMITLSAANSRMKDFFDVHILLNSKSFDGRKLYEAIFETFQRRKTGFEKNPFIFDSEFLHDKNRNTMWKSFLNKINVEYIAFDKVMMDIIVFIKPIYYSILVEEEFFMKWNNIEKKWDKFKE
jgi:predicted nucleotidyltransferase component of viral defense system